MYYKLLVEIKTTYEVHGTYIKIGRDFIHNKNLILS